MIFSQTSDTPNNCNCGQTNAGCPIHRECAVPSQEEMDKAMLNLGKCDIISTNEKGFKVWECVWCGKKADNVEAFDTRCSILEDTKPEWNMIESMVRDFTQVVPRSKSEVRERIDKLLLTQREELEREIEVMMKPKSYWSYPWWRCDEIAYNQAIGDVLEVLKDNNK